MNVVKVLQQQREQRTKKLIKLTAKKAPESDDLEIALVDAIDELFESSNGKIWKQSNSFAPSNTNQCARYAVYRLRGFEQRVSFSGQTRRIFDFGNRVEDMMEGIFDDLGILVDKQLEINIEDPVPIRGFIDFVVDWDGPKVVECKSINEAGMIWRRQSHKPTDAHYRQIQFYLHAMGYNEGFVLYVGKNDSSILPLLTVKDDKFIEKTLKKYAKIYKVYQEGNIPVRPYKETSDKCVRCDAREWCWADTEVGVKI